jgi:hypothetical protein
LSAADIFFFLFVGALPAATSSFPGAFSSLGSLCLDSALDAAVNRVGFSVVPAQRSQAVNQFGSGATQPAQTKTTRWDIIEAFPGNEVEP